MAVFIGEFNKSIDAKNRLTIPGPLRQALQGEADGKGFLLVQGTNGRLWAFTEGCYRRLAQAASSSPAGESAGLAVMCAMAVQVRPDARGRIVIPASALRRTGLGRQVTLIGVQDHIEIWPLEAWNQHVEQALRDGGFNLCEPDGSPGTGH